MTLDEKMPVIAQALDEALNSEARGEAPKMGFALLVFPFEGGRCSYISNGANRSDVVALMKEMIAKFEGRLG